MIKKTCKCGKPVRKISEWAFYEQRDCRVCHAKAMRKFRKNHPLDEEARLKMNARSYLNVYIQRGKIQRQPCVKCGKRAQAHHDDYSKPLVVRWFCRPHHLEWHRNND